MSPLVTLRLSTQPTSKNPTLKKPIATRLKCALITVVLILLMAITCCHIGFFIIKKSAVLLYYAPPDLKSFYWAAQAVFIEHASPYSVDYLRSLAAQHVFPYLYPPTSLLLFSPLSLLTFQQAHLSLLSLNHVMIPVIALTLIFFFKSEKKQALQRLFGFMLALNLLLSFAPTHGTLALGQINLIVLCFILLFILSLQKQSNAPLTAALLLIPIVLKTYPALLVVYLLVRRRFLIMGWLCLYFAVLFIISLYALPNGLWMIWLSEIVPGGTYGAIPEGLNAASVPWNQNLNAFIHRSLTFLEQRNRAPSGAGSIINGLGYGVSVCFILISVLTCHHARKKQSDNYLIECGLFLLVMLMVAPLTWDHHFLFVIPAYLGCAHASFDPKNRNIPRIISLIIIGIILSSKFKFSSPFFNQGWSYLLASGKFYMVAWLWIISLRIIISHNNPFTQPADKPD